MHWFSKKKLIVFINPQNFSFYLFFLIYSLCVYYILLVRFFPSTSDCHFHISFTGSQASLNVTYLFFYLNLFVYWKKFSRLRLLIPRLLSGILDFLVFSNRFDSYPMRIITSLLTWRAMVFKSLKKLMTTYTWEFYCLEALLTKNSCMTKICLAILTHTCDVLSLCLSSLSFNSIYKSNCSTFYTSRSALCYSTPVSVSL